jgi:hypothetical protein
MGENKRGTIQRKAHVVVSGERCRRRGKSERRIGLGGGASGIQKSEPYKQAV